jgi:hypothetical protein
MVVIIATWQHPKRVQGLGWQIGTVDAMQFSPSHLVPDVFRRTFMIPPPPPLLFFLCTSSCPFFKLEIWLFFTREKNTALK